MVTKKISALALTLGLLFTLFGAVSARADIFGFGDDNTEADSQTQGYYNPYCPTCIEHSRHKSRRVAALPIQRAAAQHSQRTPAVSGGRLFIRVSIGGAYMQVFKDGVMIRQWPVGTGGRYHGGRYHFTPPHPQVGQVLGEERVHYSREYNNAPLPYAIHLFGAYFIHEGRTGKGVSNGCIHLSPQNAQELYSMVASVGSSNTSYQIL